jgi:DNA polymerase III alpha subunit
LQICEALAGLPPGRANLLRRALNKYKQKTVDKIRREFIASAKARGFTDENIV